MKNYINFDEIYPELKTNKYFYHNNFLQNSIIVKNKDSNIKIISNRDIYNISITDLYEHDLEAFNQNINLLIDFVSQKLNISAPYFFPLEINCEIMLRFNKKLYTFKKYFDIENFITTFPSAEIDKIYNPIDNYENENNSKLFIKSICRIDYDKFKTQFNKTDGYNYDITTLPLYKIQPPLNLIPKQHTNLVIKPIENDTTNISFKLILKIFDKENYVEMVNLSDMLYEKDRYYHLLKFINKESIKINDVNNKKELPIIITFDKPTDIEKIEIVELYIKKYLSEYPLKLPIII
jgi:hypothetical protein